MDTSRKPVLPNQQRGANPLSQLLFFWLIPLLWSGYKHGLNTDNLTECIADDRSAQLGDQLEKEWYREIRISAKKKRLPKLKLALLRTFSASILPEGTLFLCATIARTSIPFLLAHLLSLFQAPALSSAIAFVRTNESAFSQSYYHYSNITSPDTQIIWNQIWNDKYCIGALIFMVTLAFILLYHHGVMKQRMLGSRMRIACCSLIYRKTLRLSKMSASQTTAGYLVNLLSNDVNRMDMGFLAVHYIWLLPIQALCITYLIYLQVGWPAFIGVGSLLLMTMPVQTFLSHLLARLRLKIAKRTDKRVGIMNELVLGIKVIKMYAWETYFRGTARAARDRELRQIRFASYIRGFNLSTAVFAERTPLFITILTCAIIGQTTPASMVFSMAQFFNVLKLTAAVFYPLALSYGGETLISIDRIEELLLMQEHEIKGTNTTEKTKSKQLLELSHFFPDSYRIQNKENAIEITNVTASWDPIALRKTLEDVTFSVQSGSLCAIIGAVGAGKVYATIKSSILQLVLGGLTASCGRVVQGDDETISYASQEPWIFAGTVRHNILFGQTYNEKRYEEVINCCSLLRDFELLPDGDKTLVNDRGASLSGGQRARIALARAIYQDASVYLLDDPLSAVDAHVGRDLFEHLIGPGGLLSQRNATRLLVTHQVHLLQQCHQIVIVNEGKIIDQGSYEDLMKRNSKMLTNAKNTKAADADENVEKQVGKSLDMSEDAFVTKKDKSKNSIVENAEEMGSNGIVQILRRYLIAGSSVWQLIFLVIILFFSQLIICLADFYLTYWTDRERLRYNGIIEDGTKFVDLYIYAAMLLLVIIFSCIRCVMFFNLCNRSSKALHNQICNHLLRAPMRFFDTNPPGRILNRFSKDLGAVDETLPCSMIESLFIILMIIGIFCVVCILNPIMIVFLAISLFFCVALLKFYYRGAQDLKRLEGITRSPVFTHITASLNGLSTIRSCGLEQCLVQEFDGLQDVHSSVWRLSIVTNTALGLWLDCISGLFVLCITYSFITLVEDASSVGVGMALSQAMILTTVVQYGVRQTTLALQQMTNLERVQQYTELQQENDPNVEPPVDWPKTGTISFNKMTLRYEPKGDAILYDLTLHIQAGWKVGIVGRTGAGKSSLISALFRIAFIDGQIMIDDIDTASISLKSLRSRVSIIPQDPVLFSASIRVNLDPFQQFTDDELWSALGAVELKGVVPSLDFVVTESGANFSVGQRQLVCLARAILRRDKVLVLDEATANVDQQTDALIQRTIRERFVSSTVLTVAHRLRTVMDSDRILVMDAGHVCEFDKPHNLLQIEGGVLRGMVNATGQEQQTLRQIAADSFAKYH